MHSEGWERDVLDHQEADGRPTMLIYAGDWDASGEVILANLLRWVPFDRVDPVALKVDQVFEQALPLVPSDKPKGKGRNTHWPAFRERHHDRLVALGWDPSRDWEHPHQVELDALDPAVLRQLYADAIAEVWDDQAHQEVLEREAAEREWLHELARDQRGGDER